MTVTKLALRDAKSAADLRAKIEALLAGENPQEFTPALTVEVVHHYDERCSTGDLLAGHFAGPMAGR